MPPAASLQIDLKNKKPVELLDLAASFEALGLQYRDYISGHGFDPIAGNVRLYVQKIESGSILAVLQAMADQASFVIDHRDAFLGFLANFNDLVQFFLGHKTESASSVTRVEAERVSQILEPVAKDSGSQLILTIQGDLKAEVHHHYGSEQANAVQNGVRRFLGPSPQETGSFSREVLYLSQARADIHSKAGDRGIIEKFSTRAVKLLFMNEDAKRAVIDSTENPFKMAFIVDGQISTVESKPALYKISLVHEAFERP